MCAFVGCGAYELPGQPGPDQRGAEPLRTTIPTHAARTAAGATGIYIETEIGG